MKTAKRYLLEHVLVVATLLLSVSGFWNIYFGDGAAPTAYHHLHLATVFTWLFVLLYQLNLVRNRKHESHRRLGLAVLFLGPLMFASVSLLSVHSAHKGVVSGQGDFLIVQNVMTTLVLGSLILLAFVLRKRRKLHGSLLMGTTILFMGIALFFTLISFVPQYRIEGPDTFHRFAAAAMAGQAATLVVALVFLARDFRNGWPYLLAAASFPANEWIRSTLDATDLIGPLTAFVGSMNPTATFAGSFLLLIAALTATGMLGARRRVADSGAPSATVAS